MNLFKKLSPILSHIFHILKLTDVQPLKSNELENENPENLIWL